MITDSRIVKKFTLVSGLVVARMKLTTTKRQWAFLMMLATVATVLAGAALATPPFGILSAPIFARASFVDPTDIKFKIKGLKIKGQGQEVIQVNNAQETVIQQIVIAPGGHTGWHSHPGPVVVLVKAGELTLYSGEDPSCTGTTYSAGEAFIDSGQGHVHIARNEGDENVELWVTYFDVPPGGAFRIDAADPGNCSF